MKIDYSYLSNILSKFLDSPDPNIDFHSFGEEIGKDSNKFFFHLIILADKGLVCSATKEPSNIGVRYNGNNGEYDYWITPLRLTAAGHDFADAITKPSINETIIGKFKDEGFSAVIDIAKKLALKRAEEMFEDVI